MARWCLVVLFLMMPLAIGCGKKAIGPVDESQVKQADPAMIEKMKQESMEKSKQFRPKS